MANYYTLLGISEDSTQEEIKKRYRFLVQAYHPDRYHDSDSKAQAEEEMKKINTAYDTLSDPEKRRDYDFKHKINTGNNDQKETSHKNSSGIDEEYENYLNYLKEHWFARVVPLLSEDEIQKNVKNISDDIRLMVKQFGYGQSEKITDQNYEELTNYLDLLIFVNLSLGAVLREKSLPGNIKINKVSEITFFPFIIRIEEMWNNDFYHSKNEHYYHFSTKELIENLVVLSKICQRIGISHNYQTQSTSSSDRSNTNANEKNPSRGKKIEEGYCQNCGKYTSVQKVLFEQNIGLLFLRLKKRFAGNLCAVCNQTIFWRFTGTTIILGWWGIISFFITPFLLIGNLIYYFSSLQLRKLSNEKMSSEAKLWKAGIILIFSIISLFLLFTYLGSLNKIPSSEKPAINIIPSATISSISVPTKTIIQPTVIEAFNPTLSTTKECVSWNEITVEDIDKNVCIIGVVKEIKTVNNQYHMLFGDSYLDFHLIVRDVRRDDFIDQCVKIIGTVNDYNNIPVIRLSGYTIKTCD